MFPKCATELDSGFIQFSRRFLFECKFVSYQSEYIFVCSFRVLDQIEKVHWNWI